MMSSYVDENPESEYLNQDRLNRILEINRRLEEEKRNWREEKEIHGRKRTPTNYNLGGNMEGLLNFLFWKCDCCQRGFQRVKPHITDKNVFQQGGQNVAIQTNNQIRIVPLCNGCITLYYERGWLAVKK
jgi:hypothetical protein